MYHCENCFYTKTIRGAERLIGFTVKEQLGLLCLSECLCKYLPSHRGDPGLSLTFAATFWYHLLVSVFRLCCHIVA